MYCQECCILLHRLLPFHRILSWNGGHFEKTTLHAMGYVLHLGHKGKPCPNNSGKDEQEDEEMEGLDDIGVPPAENKHIADDIVKTVDVIDTAGVFRHTVRWCYCRGGLDRPTQLFQMGLFPASLQRPETAFTFNVLDYFHIDAMECSTSASNFVTKVRRLTNNAFPHTVRVSIIVLMIGTTYHVAISESPQRAFTCVSNVARSSEPKTFWLWA